MKQLSTVDAGFLYMESPEVPMHVGALNIYELPADYTGDFLSDVRRHMASRVALAPALHRKLVWMPLNMANPVWVDVEPDLNKHVVGVALPRGSGMVELERQVGELHSQLLDRSRPLWKFFIFEGLADGPNGEKRFGLYSQLHHAAVDGQAAVALGEAIWDIHPIPREITAKPRHVDPVHVGVNDLLRDAFANHLQLVGDMVKSVPSTLSALSQAATQLASQGVKSVMAGARQSPGEGMAALGSALGLAPRVSLNSSVTSERVYATVSLSLAELNEYRRPHHASLNDALLMICSGALRRYFTRHGPLPKKSLLASVPISLRAQGDVTSNTQAAMGVVSLGTHIAKPAERLAHVMASTANMKNLSGGIRAIGPTDYPSLGIPWMVEGLSSLFGRAHLADTLPPVSNLVISNVPGSPMQLYMAGARLLTNYPTSIVHHGLGLNITVESYNGSLDMGLMACPTALASPAELAADIRAAFAEFKAMPVPQEVVVEPPKAPKADAKSPSKAQARGAKPGAAQSVVAQPIEEAVPAQPKRAAARAKPKAKVAAPALELVKAGSAAVAELKRARKKAEPAALVSNGTAVGDVPAGSDESLADAPKVKRAKTSRKLAVSQ